VKSRIFEPYFTTKGAGEGSGLGLAVAHGIVVSHGGGISVQSEPGRGTSIAVYLPVLGERQAAFVEQSADPPRGDERILFVDDEQEILRVSTKMLSLLGYRVTSFSSSVKALEELLADPERYDLVITDQTLPDLSGADLVRRFLEVRPGMPMIICTGYSRTLDEKRARAIGAKGLLLKPFTVETLAGAVRDALDHPGS
jgi:CheY-like chemotaxis protein